MQNSFPFKGEVVKVQTTEKGGRGWGGGGGVCPQPGHRAQVAERVGEETNVLHRPRRVSPALEAEPPQSWQVRQLTLTPDGICGWLLTQHLIQNPVRLYKLLDGTY